MGTADILALQGTLGNQAVMRLIEGARSRSHRHEGTASGAIQRDKLKGEPAKVQQAKQALKQALGGKTASDCKKQIEKRLPDGPLFTSTEIGDIIELSKSPGGAKWLKQVGIGTFDDAYQYLVTANYKD
jgi:hypothetical protein